MAVRTRLQTGVAYDNQHLQGVPLMPPSERPPINDFGTNAIDTRLLKGADTIPLYSDTIAAPGGGSVEAGTFDGFIMASVDNLAQWMPPSALASFMDLAFVPLAGTKSDAPVTGEIRFRGGDPDYWLYESASISGGDPDSVGPFGDGAGRLRLGSGIDGLDNATYPPFEIIGQQGNAGVGYAQLKPGHKLRDTTDPVSDDDLARKGFVIAKSIGTSKGQLVGFSASGTPIAITAPVSNGSVLTSDTSQTGGVTWAAPMAVGLYNPDYAGAATISATTERLLDWNTEDYDHGGLHAAGSSDIVIPTDGAGVYHFDAQVYFTTVPAGIHEAYLRVHVYNASNVLQRDMYGNNKGPAGMATAAHVTLSKDVYLDDGWYFRVSVWQNSGGSLAMNTGSGKSTFNAHRVAVV